MSEKRVSPGEVFVGVQLAFLGLAAISMFCDRNLLRKLIGRQHQQIFDQLCSGACNESKEFLNNLDMIPDEKEPEAARMFNYALDRFVRHKRRGSMGKIDGKRHRVLLGMSGVVANIYSRGEDDIETATGRIVQLD